MKQCTKCKQLKNETEFDENKLMFDSLHPICRLCMKPTVYQEAKKTVLKWFAGCCGK